MLLRIVLISADEDAPLATWQALGRSQNGQICTRRPQSARNPEVVRNGGFVRIQPEAVVTLRDEIAGGWL